MTSRKLTSRKMFSLREAVNLNLFATPPSSHSTAHRDGDQELFLFSHLSDNLNVLQKPSVKQDAWATAILRHMKCLCRKFWVVEIFLDERGSCTERNFCLINYPFQSSASVAFTHSWEVKSRKRAEELSSSLVRNEKFPHPHTAPCITGGVLPARHRLMFHNQNSSRSSVK